MKWGKKQLTVDENGQSVTVKGTDGTVYVLSLIHISEPTRH